MKNAINYYYNIYPKDIYQTKEEHYFIIDNIKYSLIKYDKDPKELESIYNMHLYILSSGIYVHQIILNKEGKIITLINNQQYILLKQSYTKDKITLEEISKLQNIKLTNNYNLEYSNWIDLWSEKNDYLEYQTSMLGLKYPLITESFNYFIGLGETAISLVSEIEKTNIVKTCTHRRLKEKDIIYSLYNPLNIVVDIKVRDQAEYFKMKFFEGENIYTELQNFFKYTRLSTYEYLMFLARMLYPTYYFDMYESIMNETAEESELEKIIKKIDSYENLLKQIYNYYKSFLKFTPIEWLETN